MKQVILNPPLKTSILYSHPSSVFPLSLPRPFVLEKTRLIFWLCGLKQLATSPNFHPRTLSHTVCLFVSFYYTSVRLLGMPLPHRTHVRLSASLSFFHQYLWHYYYIICKVLTPPPLQIQSDSQGHQLVSVHQVSNGKIECTCNVQAILCFSDSKTNIFSC